MLRSLVAGTEAAFAPKTKPRRMAMHSFATAAGVAGAIRMDAAHSLLLGIAWYAGFFFCAHVAVVPFTTAFYMLRARVERWVRGIIEEELIRFDLRTYQRQLHRVFPMIAASDREDEESDAP